MRTDAVSGHRIVSATMLPVSSRLLPLIAEARKNSPTDRASNYFVKWELTIEKQPNAPFPQTRIRLSG
jgi:hypothetical protein